MPPGYPAGIEQKILASDLDETRKMGSRTRLLRFAPGVFTTSPFVHAHWEEVYLVSGDLIVGNDARGKGGEPFQAPTYACRRPAFTMAPSSPMVAACSMKFITTTRAKNSTALAAPIEPRVVVDAPCWDCRRSSRRTPGTVTISAIGRPNSTARQHGRGKRLFRARPRDRQPAAQRCGHEYPSRTRRREVARSPCARAAVGFSHVPRQYPRAASLCRRSRPRACRRAASIAAACGCGRHLPACRSQ